MAPPEPPPQAPRWKMVVLLYALLWPLVNTIPRLARSLLGAHPAVDALSLLVVVVVMVYVAIPTATRLARPWLFPET